jgi:hypothetical protein
VKKPPPDSERAAELSVAAAQDCNFDLLHMRLLAGVQLSREERLFLAQLLRHLSNAPQRQKGEGLSDDEKFEIAFAYHLLKALNPGRLDKDAVVPAVCKAFNVSPRTVKNARDKHRIDPGEAQGLINIMGGRDEAERWLDRIAAVYRRFG